MKEYLEHTYNIISTSFDRHLYQTLKKLESDLDEADKKNFQHLLKSLINNDPNSTKNYYREALNIHSALTAKSKSSFRFSLLDKQFFKSIFSFIDEVKKTTTNLTSEYSKAISESLLCILKKDPRRIAFVINKLNGQQLTNNMVYKFFYLFFFVVWAFI